VRIPELDPQRKDLEKFVVSTASRMDSSAFCLTLFTENYAKGLDSLLQFAVAMMMDKPIFLLVPEGVTVPANVLKVAGGIERFDPKDKASMTAATERLMRAAMQKTLTA
jgi:hypothetical protein